MHRDLLLGFYPVFLSQWFSTGILHQNIFHHVEYTNPHTLSFYAAAPSLTFFFFDYALTLRSEGDADGLLDGGPRGKKKIKLQRFLKGLEGYSMVEIR